MIYEYVRDNWQSSLILGSLDSFFGKLGRGIARQGRRSMIVQTVRPLFARPDLWREQRERSLICYGVSVLYGRLLALVRLIYTAFSKIPPFSWLTWLADRIIGLRLSYAAAVLMAVILCVDDSRWSNGYMFLAALFLGLLFLVREANEKHRIRGSLPVSLYMWMGIAALAIFQGYFVSEALHVYSYFVTSALFMIVLAGSVRSMRELRTVCMILYCAVVVTSIMAILQSIAGIAVNTSYTDVTLIGGMPGRAYATFYNPNNFAEILVLLTPCAFAAFMTDERVNNSAKGVIEASFALPVAALMLTYSRSSWISFALVAGAFVALTNLRLIPLFLLLAVLAIPVLPASITNRVLTLFTGNDTSMGYRLYIWEGVRRMLRWNPWSGIGLGTHNFYDIYRRFMMYEAFVAAHAHNLFLEIWLETGIFGLFSSVLLYLSTLKNTLLSVTKGSRGFRWMAIGLFSTLFGMIFVELVEYIWFYPRVMLVFWSVLGLSWALLRIGNTAERDV